MTDLRQHFASLDGVPAPNLWGEIERRASIAATGERVARRPVLWRPLEGRRPLLLIAATALLLGMVLGVLAVGTGLIKLPTTPTILSQSTGPTPSAPLATFPLATLPAETLPAQPPQPARFVAGGSLFTGRTRHFAVLLRDGSVLVGGGRGPLYPGTRSSWMMPAVMERWDPATQTFNVASRLGPRDDESYDGLTRMGQQVVLQADGSVLIVPAGCPCSPQWVGHAQVWHPDGGAGTLETIDSLELARGGHSATELADGRILIAGGVVDPFQSGPIRKAEIWDAVAGTITPTGRLNLAREFHRATLLADGRVLVVGGLPENCCEAPVKTAEVWDPATGQFTVVPSLDGFTGDWIDLSTLSLFTLPDGRVLILNGAGARTWDPATDEVSGGTRYLQRRSGFAAALLPNGQVLVVGGAVNPENGAPIGGAELWDPASGTFQPAGMLLTPRISPSATTLADGRVLIVGGYEPTPGGAPSPIAGAEIWEPATP